MNKARTYGLPRAVVDLALSQGVHPDCLVARDISKVKEACQECAEKTWAAIDTVYAHLETPEERARQVAEDTRVEQREG